MKIAVAGGFGFLGKHIILELHKAGHEVTVFARREEELPDGISFAFADLMVPGEWQKWMMSNDVVINLVGVNLFQRWNKTIKKLIYDSRIISTANIGKSVTSGDSKCRLLINASATGYYGLRGDETITEISDAGKDFLATVCRDWEMEAVKAGSKKLRVVILRFGSIFGSDGGAFPALAKSFKFLLGSKLGKGTQWFPWVHVDDAAGVVLKAVSDRKMHGAYNCSAPGIVTNRELTEILAKAVRRPVILPFVPGFMLRIVFGEFGSFLTGGQRAVPAKLLDEGYRFRFPELSEAFADLLRQQSR